MSELTNYEILCIFHATLVIIDIPHIVLYDANKQSTERT